MHSWHCYTGVVFSQPRSTNRRHSNTLSLFNYREFQFAVFFVRRPKLYFQWERWNFQVVGLAAVSCPSYPLSIYNSFILCCMRLAQLVIYLRTLNMYRIEWRHRSCCTCSKCQSPELVGVPLVLTGTTAHWRLTAGTHVVRWWWYWLEWRAWLVISLGSRWWTMGSLLAVAAHHTRHLAERRRGGVGPDSRIVDLSLLTEIAMLARSAWWRYSGCADITESLGILIQTLISHEWTVLGRGRRRKLTTCVRLSVKLTLALVCWGERRHRPWRCIGRCMLVASSGQSVGGYQPLVNTYGTVASYCTPPVQVDQKAKI